MAYQPSKKPGNVDHVDRDEQTGTSIGGYLEPEAQDLVTGRKAPDEEGPKEVHGNSADDEKRYGVTARDDIYAKGREVRDHQIDEHEAQDEDAAEFNRRMNIEAGGGDPYEGGEEESAEEESAEEESARPAETQKKDPGVAEEEDPWVELTVYGEKELARFSEVEEAGGIDVLQKRKAADRLMVENTSYRRQIDNEAKQLAQAKAEFARQVRTFAERQVAWEEQQQTTSAPSSTLTGEPSGNEVGDLGIDIDGVTNALYEGDRESFKQGLARFAQQVARQATAQQEPSTPEDRESRTNKLAQELSTELGFTVTEDDLAALGDQELQQASGSDVPREEAAAVNQMFETEYPEMWRDDDAFRRVQYDLSRRRALPENQGRALMDLTRESISHIERTFWEPTHGKAEILPKEEVERRLRSKRKTPGATRTAQVNREEPEPQVTKTQRDSNYVQSLQKQRGQRV